MFSLVSHFFIIALKRTRQAQSPKTPLPTLPLTSWPIRSVHQHFACRVPPKEITDEGNDHEQSLGRSSEGQPGEALYKGCYQVRRQVAVGRETEETSMDKSQQASQQTHQPKQHVKLRISGVL